MKRLPIQLVTFILIVGCSRGSDPLVDNPSRPCGELASYGNPRIEIKGQDMFSIESTHTFTVTVSSGLDAIGVCSLDPSTLEYRWASRSDAKAIQALAIGPGPVAVLTATRLGDYNFEVNVFRGGIDIGRASVQAQAAVPELVGFIDLRGALYEASNVPCCPDSSDPSAPDELRRLLVSLNRAEQDWLIRDELESLSALRDMRKIIANDHEGQAKWQALLTRIDLQVSHIEQHKVVPRNER